MMETSNPIIAIRCRFYSDDAEPIDGGCLRKDDGCSFIHPEDSAWASAMPFSRAPSSSAKSLPRGPKSSSSKDVKKGKYNSFRKTGGSAPYPKFTDNRAFNKTSKFSDTNIDSAWTSTNISGANATSIGDSKWKSRSSKDTGNGTSSGWGGSSFPDNSSSSGWGVNSSKENNRDSWTSGWTGSENSGGWSTTSSGWGSVSNTDTSKWGTWGSTAGDSQNTKSSSGGWGSAWGSNGKDTEKSESGSGGWGSAWGSSGKDTEKNESGSGGWRSACTSLDKDASDNTSSGGWGSWVSNEKDTGSESNSRKWGSTSALKDTSNDTNSVSAMFETDTGDNGESISGNRDAEKDNNGDSVGFVPADSSNGKENCNKRGSGKWLPIGANARECASAAGAFDNKIKFSLRASIGDASLSGSIDTESSNKMVPEHTTSEPMDVEMAIETDSGAITDTVHTGLPALTTLGTQAVAPFSEPLSTVSERPAKPDRPRFEMIEWDIDLDWEHYETEESNRIAKLKDAALFTGEKDNSMMITPSDSLATDLSEIGPYASSEQAVRKICRKYRLDRSVQPQLLTIMALIRATGHTYNAATANADYQNYKAMQRSSSYVNATGRAREILDGGRKERRKALHRHMRRVDEYVQELIESDSSTSMKRHIVTIAESGSRRKPRKISVDKSDIEEGEIVEFDSNSSPHLISGDTSRTQAGRLKARAAFTRGDISPTVDQRLAEVEEQSIAGARQQLKTLYSNMNTRIQECISLKSESEGFNRRLETIKVEMDQIVSHNEQLKSQVAELKDKINKSESQRQVYAAEKEELKRLLDSFKVEQGKLFPHRETPGSDKTVSASPNHNNILNHLSNTIDTLKTDLTKVLQQLGAAANIATQQLIEDALAEIFPKFHIIFQFFFHLDEKNVGFTIKDLNQTGHSTKEVIQVSA